ncbi:MAG: hypothetical protein IPH18_04855 [Chitinophagaceae bacterium]|nr:hypothetical protein [Chitinophagaceae bacterium]MBK8953754.1 hypothetical protein [Chitinophagaceae bacterium]
MKQIIKRLSENSFQLLAMIAGAVIFSFLFLGFTEKQTSTEKLLGFSTNYDKQEVTITVVTTGCTTKADFSIKVSGSNITVVRKKRDMCKMMPDAVSFTYTMKEAGVDPNKAYTIKNKFVANPNLANIP